MAHASRVYRSVVRPKEQKLVVIYHVVGVVVHFRLKRLTQNIGKPQATILTTTIRNRVFWGQSFIFVSLFANWFYVTVLYAIVLFY